MHHALWDDKALIGQELDRSSVEIDYESAAQDVEKLIIIVVFVPVVLALHYAEPSDCTIGRRPSLQVDRRRSK